MNWTAAAFFFAWFFLSLAVANLPALIGFIGVFIANELWPYLVGMGLSLLAFSLFAPTRREIERRQQQITGTGSPLSLGETLMGAASARPD